VKSAGVGQYLRDPRVVGGVLGGVLAGGATALEATGHGPSLDKLRDRIAEKDERMKQPGMRNFARSMDLAQDRAMLTLGEAVQAHPVASTLALGTLGAVTGAKLPGEVSRLWQEAASYHKG
jgi:hypothetical protein